MVVTWKKLMAAIEHDPAFKGKMAQSQEETPKDTQARANIDRLFKFIGAYIVVFQDVESKLDQIIVLAMGLERWHLSHSVLAHLSNSQKIEIVQSVVHTSAIASGGKIQREWLRSFDEVIQRLRTEAMRRNRIVHSLYLFDFMEVGGPALRSKRRRTKGEIGLDQEWVGATYIGRATSEVNELSFDLGMALAQLRHWSELLGQTRPATA